MLLKCWKNYFSVHFLLIPLILCMFLPLLKCSRFLIVTLLIFLSAFCPLLSRSTSSLSQDLMLERFNRGKAKFDKPVSIPSPGECGADTSLVAPCGN